MARWQPPPGTIILYRLTYWSRYVDKLIVWGQRVCRRAPNAAKYYHVALVGYNGITYEATWPKIRRYSRDWDSVDAGTEFYTIKGITGPQIAQAISYADKSVGKWYDVLAILTFGMVQLGPGAVCSQFVWEALTAANVLLCPYDCLESPDEIAASPLLVPYAFEYE